MRIFSRLRLRHAALFAAAATAWGACAFYPGGPLIITVDPGFGETGSQITITGYGFGGTQGTAMLSFAGTSAETIVEWGKEQIVAIVPPQAMSGSLVVESDAGTSNEYAFVVGSSATPLVIDVLPSAAAAGELITVTGTGFGATQGSSAVTIGGSPVSDYSAWSNTAIVLEVPASAPGGPVEVAIAGFAPASHDFDVAPTVSDVQPAAATYGDVVTVIGSGFGASPGVVTIGGTAPATYLSWTNSVVVFNLPAATSVGDGSLILDNGPLTSDAMPITTKWQALTTLDGLPNNNTYDVALTATEILVATWGSGVARTADEGATWTVFDTADGLPGNSTRAVELKGTDIWVGTSVGAARSTDGGSTWSAYTTAEGLGNNYVLSIAVDPTSGDVWLGTNNGGVSVSADDGASWTNFTTAQGLSGNSVRGVYADGAEIWAATSARLNRSLDGGASWTWFSTLEGMGSNYGHDIGLVSGRLFVPTNDGGVSLTADDGATWQVHHTAHGLGANLVRAVATRSDRVAVATSAGIAFAAP